MKVYEAWLKICIVFTLLWIIFLLVTIKSKMKQEDIPNENLTTELISALLKLNDLHKTNTVLKHRVMVLTKKLNIINEQNNSINKQLNGPSEEYEQLRRRIFSNMNEFWYYISFQLRSLETEFNNLKPFIPQIIDNIDEHYWSLISDVAELAKVDGYSDWRYTEFSYLSTLIKKRLRFLQNPQDCSKVKKLACNFIPDHRPCGFCCRLHQLVNCMIVAYASRRMLVLDNPVNWRFTSGELKTLFFPLSIKCTSSGNNETVLPWPGDESVQVVNLSLPATVPDNGPNHLQRPLTQLFNLLVLPEDLSRRLNVLHTDPALWWISQFVNYIVRPQLSIYDIMDNYKDNLNFDKSVFPPICMHIRRSDVIGSSHKLDEYMYQLKKYYEKLKLSRTQPFTKQIYFSTDDPTLFEEAKNLYPDYDIIGNLYISETPTTWELDESIMNINVNVLFLSRCAYLVCNLSSHVCRLAYEIKNGLQLEDSLAWFTSMGDEYSFNDQTRKRYVAVLPHKANGPHEMDLQVGDEIEVVGNQRNGYSNGTHLRTNKTLLYPTFKVTQKIENMTFASYSDIKISLDEFQ